MGQLRPHVSQSIILKDSSRSAVAEAFARPQRLLRHVERSEAAFPLPARSDRDAELREWLFLTRAKAVRLNLHEFFITAALRGHDYRVCWNEPASVARPS